MGDIHPQINYKFLKDHQVIIMLYLLEVKYSGKKYIKKE